MKLIIISGPTNAGKDKTVDQIVQELEKEHPGQVSRSEYFKTRVPRDDEDKKSPYFITKEEFDKKRETKEIADKFNEKVGDYQVGYNLKEFEKSEIVVVNIDDQKARLLKEMTAEKGGKTLTIFLYASEETLIHRYRLRESLLFEDEARFRLENDITDPNPENHRDFDMVVENKEGFFEQTMNEIMPKVKEFLKA